MGGRKKRGGDRVRVRGGRRAGLASASVPASGAASAVVLRRKDVSTVAAELEQKYMEECTFKPKINKSFRSDFEDKNPIIR